MLSELVERIRQNHEISSYNEDAIKQAIVLPLLHKLEWDTYNISEVTPEYTVESRRVDYALRIGPRVEVFLEVKNGREDLERHEEQLLDYSFRVGVESAVLTNGRTWWFYLPTRKGSWKERRYYAVDIFEQETEDVAGKFQDFLSRPNVQSGIALKNAESVYAKRFRKRLIRDALPEVWGKLLSDRDSPLLDVFREQVEKSCGILPEKEDILDFLHGITQVDEASMIMDVTRKQEQFRPLEENIVRRNKGRFNVSGNTLEIEVTKRMKDYMLVTAYKDVRSFFPGYDVEFVIKTGFPDIGNIRTHVTSKVESEAKIGDKNEGLYIATGLRPWYRKVKPNIGDWIQIEKISEKEFKISLLKKTG